MFYWPFNNQRWVQWNLRKRTHHITETSTMQTNGCGPESFPVHSNLRIAETSLLRVTDTKDTPQWIKFLSKNRQQNSWKIFTVLEDFSHFYPFFDVSRPLCTQGVLVHAKRSNTWHAATGKDCHITRPGALSVSLYKGYRPIADNLVVLRCP